MKKNALLMLFMAFWVSSQLFAQTTISLSPKTKPFELGVVEEIQSQILSEKRILNIYLPPSYKKEGTDTYPVIYLLDGSADEDFIHIVGLVQFLTMIGALPNSIVVGIANVDRKRDFTYPTTIEQDKKDFPTTGSSEKFISFLEKEVQPYIQKQYRTNTQKTLIGQSLGGLLATEILFKKPTLFSDYIIVSPSLWWDNESLLLQTEKITKTQLSTSIKVCVAVGNEGDVMKGGAERLVETLKKAGNAQIKVDFCFLPEENHATILHRSVYKAFEVLNPSKK